MRHRFLYTLFFAALSLGALASRSEELPIAAPAAELAPSAAPTRAPTQGMAPQRDTAFRWARPAPELLAIGGPIWRSLGPAGILGGQTENVTPDDLVSGGVHAVVPHPSNPNRIWIATVNGGIWETRNARAVLPTWRPLTDLLPSLSVSALELDPTDPQSRTLLAGLGNISSYGQSGLLDGLLLTRNGGQSWRRIDHPLLRGHSISAVAARGRTLLASATSFFDTFEPGGVFRSTDGGTSWSQVASIPTTDVFDMVGDPANPARLFAIAAGGVFRSDDTGATWTDVSSTDPPLTQLLTDPSISNAELDVGPGGRLFAAVTRFGLFVYIGFLDSTGPAWTAMDLPFTPESGFVPVDAAELDPSGVLITSPAHGLQTGLQVETRDIGGISGANGVFIVLVEDEDRFILFEANAAGTHTGGGIWRLVTGLNPKAKSNGNQPGPFGPIRRPGGQGSIHLSISADPTDPNIVYLGGDRQDLNFNGEELNHLGAENFTGRLFRGDTRIAATGAVPSPQWDHLTHRSDIADMPGGGTASTSAPHADSREIAFDAAGDLIEGNDGGIFRRTSPRDNTGDWFAMSGDLANTELHNVAYDRVSGVVIGGAQDVGTPMDSLRLGPRVWFDWTQGDGGDVQVDDVSLAGQGQSIRYTAFPFFPIASRSIWDADNNFIEDTQPAMEPLDGIFAFGSFTTPVELNTINPRRLVIGGENGVFESFDRGDTTRRVGEGILDFQNAIAYGGRRRGVANANVLWYGTGAEVFLRTTAGGIAAPTAAPFPGDSVRDVALSPDDWRVAYVADSDSVYVTTNAGASWVDITGDLEDVSLRSLAVVRFTPFIDHVIAGGLTGVSVTAVVFGAPSPDQAWFEIGSNLPNALVWDLDWDPVDNLLTVATLGRGAWQTTLLSTPLPEVVGEE